MPSFLQKLKVAVHGVLCMLLHPTGARCCWHFKSAAGELFRSDVRLGSASTILSQGQT